MGESEDPKEELEFYFKLANPLALSLPDAEEKSRAAAWLRRLGDAEAGSERMRADYLRLLVFALQRRRLVGVFAAPPDTSQPLQPFQGGASLSEMMRRLGTQAAKERGAGDRPGVSSMLSHDLKHFLAVQPLPHDRGAHCYMALSPDPYPSWAAKPQERSRRRSAPAQLPCPCSPDSPAPRSPLAASTPVARSPCDCRPPPPPAAPARVRCVAPPPTPRPCQCPPDQSCWCPQPVATPCPGYQSSSYDVDSDSDPLAFSWTDKPAVNAAAQDAALRALEDACEESSVRFPALWHSEESGFEPMEWDSYHKGNVCPGRAGEYRGGRVYTTASRMEVRRSEERLPDGSVLATEERTAAGAATRVSPPPPGSCPAVNPPRGASAAVGKTQRRITWTPPPATSSPCECLPPSRRRVSLPYSPPSPITSPCRRIRISSPTSTSMTPDSLEVSRRRRSSPLRTSLRSPRRSYSAESIVPCPASGRQLDSVTPPSGLRFSGSAGLSRSPCPARSLSPCPASRRRSPSPLTVCPAARGIDSVTPPSGMRFSGSGPLVTPCPSYSGAGIDSTTPPSGLLSGSRTRSPTPPPCAPKRGSPAPCAPAPCLPPPCSPYAGISRPKRFFSPPKGRRPALSPPCAPKRGSPAPCSPAPCIPPPCSPDPYANIARPKRFFSPLAALAKSASQEYDDSLNPCEGGGADACACTPPPPSPSPSPCPAHLRGSVPKSFYSLTGDLSPRSTPRSTPRRTSVPCPAVSAYKPRRLFGSPTAPPPSPCPAATSYEVERTPGGATVRRSYSRECPGASPSPDGGASDSATGTYVITSRSPSPEPEEYIEVPCQASLGDWTDPGPMWRNVPADADDSIDCSCDVTEDAPCGEDAFSFLDRRPNLFNFPDDSCCCDPPSFETVPCPASTPTRVLCPASTSRSRSPSPERSSRESSYSPPRPLRRWGKVGTLCTDSPSDRDACVDTSREDRTSRSWSRSPSPKDSCACDEETAPVPCPGSASPKVVCTSPHSPVPEGYVRVPCQTSLDEWVGPGRTDPDNGVDCGCDDSEEDPWAILDRTVPSFSYPPIHPRR